MWKKIGDFEYELQADPKFTLKRISYIWNIYNAYNGKIIRVDNHGLEIDEFLEVAYSVIISKFFGDIIKSVSIAQAGLEHLDTIVSQCDKSKGVIEISFEDKKMLMSVDTLVAALKQNCIEMILKAKINNLTDKD